MKVISLVPSWTETLLQTGVNVVGRTRFCVHPADKVQNIPIVGGTKNIKPDIIDQLNPNYVVLDKEENTKEMASIIKHQKLVTHIKSINDVPEELERMSHAFICKKLSEVAKRWKKIAITPKSEIDLKNFPGVLKWITPIYTTNIERIVYVIWYDPWMCVSSHTFIGSVLSQFNLLGKMYSTENKYPVFDMKELDDGKTLFLASSEPYPFLTRQKVLKDISSPLAVVDGEAFSWFGIRSLEFLETFN